MSPTKAAIQPNTIIMYDKNSVSLATANVNADWNYSYTFVDAYE